MLQLLTFYYFLFTCIIILCYRIIYVLSVIFVSLTGIELFVLLHVKKLNTELKINVIIVTVFQSAFSKLGTWFLLKQSKNDDTLWVSVSHHFLVISLSP